MEEFELRHPLIKSNSAKLPEPALRKFHNLHFAFRNSR
jgi:hypothetical protein